ncbi:unnamed protein product [Ectocarpus sp. 8 AP-2014]
MDYLTSIVITLFGIRHEIQNIQSVVHLVHTRAILHILRGLTFWIYYGHFVHSTHDMLHRNLSRPQRLLNCSASPRQRCSWSAIHGPPLGGFSRPLPSRRVFSLAADELIDAPNGTGASQLLQLCTDMRGYIDPLRTSLLVRSWKSFPSPPHQRSKLKARGF